MGRPKEKHVCANEYLSHIVVLLTLVYSFTFHTNTVLSAKLQTTLQFLYTNL